MIAPAEAITIVLVRTEEDILEVLNDANRLIAQTPLLSVDKECRRLYVRATNFLCKIRLTASRSAGLMPRQRLEGTPLLTT